MKKLNIRPFSTPLIIGVGIFSALTALLMLLGAESPLKFAHEVAGVAFSVAIVLHISTNWRPFKRYFLQCGIVITTLAWIAGVALVTTSSFLGNREPDRLVVEKIEQASLSAVARVTGLSDNELVILLVNYGIAVEDTSLTIEQLADKLGVETDAILLSVFR